MNESGDRATERRLAYAYEALARACSVAGENEAAIRWAELARQESESITDQEDRELVLSDVATITVEGTQGTT